MSDLNSSVSFSKRVTDPSPPAGWRGQAAKVVEELFPVTAPRFWDELLDLHQALLAGDRWAEVLALFQSCRSQLEEDHYLPFFRLRRLLEAHLRRVIAAEETSREPVLAALGLTGIAPLSLKPGNPIIEWSA